MASLIKSLRGWTGYFHNGNSTSSFRKLRTVVENRTSVFDEGGLSNTSSLLYPEFQGPKFRRNENTFADFENPNSYYLIHLSSSLGMSVIYQFQVSFGEIVAFK